MSSFPFCTVINYSVVIKRIIKTKKKPYNHGNLRAIITVKTIAGYWTFDLTWNGALCFVCKEIQYRTGDGSMLSGVQLHIKAFLIVFYNFCFERFPDSDQQPFDALSTKRCYYELTFPGSFPFLMALLSSFSFERGNYTSKRYSFQCNVHFQCNIFVFSVALTITVIELGKMA